MEMKFQTLHFSGDGAKKIKVHRKTAYIGFKALCSNFQRTAESGLKLHCLFSIEASCPQQTSKCFLLFCHLRGNGNAEITRAWRGAFMGSLKKQTH